MPLEKRESIVNTYPKQDSFYKHHVAFYLLSLISIFSGLNLMYSSGSVRIIAMVWQER